MSAMLAATPDAMPATRPTLATARRILNELWGYADFRYHQKKAVLAGLTGRDCVAMLPTGGGKSLCFQVPALLLPQLTLVVSPLISLMQDQVAALRRRSLPAAYLSSNQKPALRAAVHELVGQGRLKLLYVAPERLPSLMDAFPRLHPSLLAIDEAHCISEWGHDFRPHYRALGKYRRRLGNPPVIALTATATPETRTDIERILSLSRPVRVSQSFDRTNLCFAARSFTGEAARVRELTELLRNHAGTAIVYVQTRNRTDAVASVLRRRGFSAAPYHAALPAAARRALLARFLDGRIRVMVATNAFGMGIDKPDVRLVAHLGVPARPEAYYQEAGRAGRDGKPSRCDMLWMPGDLALAAKMAGVESKSAFHDSAAHLEAKRRGLDAMKRYVNARGCRRRILLEYLGERLDRCSGCDGCGLEESPRRVGGTWSRTPSSSGAR
jgi:ATP-dependent DNA helicase RecQ